MLGLALLQREEYGDAVKELEKVCFSRSFATL
jgi:hypothetical protein